MKAHCSRPLFALPCLLLCVSLLPAAQNDTQATARSADGLNIAYDVRGKGDTALVFLHGWCCDRESWKHQLDAFAGDYRVVAIDLGGHGESGKDRAKWTVDSLAADVEAVAKALDLKRVILVGHSMGGPVSLLTAKRMPDRVIGVVGVDTLHNVEFKWPEEQTKAFLTRFEEDFEGTMRSFLPGMLPEKTDPKLVKMIGDKAARADRKMAIGMMKDMSSFDAKAAMAGVKAPIRCINAAPGTLQFAQPTATDINKKYADFKAVIIEGVGHFPMLEKPAEFNQKLRDVLKELAAKK